MKTRYFKLTSLLLMLLLGMVSANASFTVSVGQHSTLTFEVNEDDTNTVTLIKCEGGEFNGVPNHGGMFLGDDVVEIPDVVTVNGVEKTVTIIGDNTSAHVPVFRYVKKVVFPATTKVIKKYSLVYEQGEYLPSTYCTFDFSKTASLQTFEPDFGTVPNYSYGYALPIIENLTVRNGVVLNEKFPYRLCYNLQFDESSTVYDLRGGCLMRKGDNETVVTILRLPEVTVPATVKHIAHSMPHYNGEEKTHITLEPGSQLETLSGYLTHCIFDSWPASVTTIEMKDVTYDGSRFEQSEFLSFEMPAESSGLGTAPFSGATFNHFEWGENPTLKTGLFSGCTFNEDLSLPKGMTTTSGAFRSTFKGKLELPESFGELLEKEFYNCYFYQDLNLPDHITEIPNQCFANAHFYGNLHLPEAAATVGDSCFYNCKFSKQLVLPDGVSEMSKLSFGFCTFNGLVLPTGLKKISANIFSESNFMAPVVLPEALEDIGAGAFSRTTFNNTTLTIPAGVMVDRSAFADCEIYKMVWQGETFDGLGSVDYLNEYQNGDGSFKKEYMVKILDMGTSVPDESSLTLFALDRLYTHCKTPPTQKHLYSLFTDYSLLYEATLYVPKGSKEVYENTAPWCYFPKIVEFDETQQCPFVGDVNGDGKVNVSDITALINHILDGSQQNALLDDVNEDSKVNVSDVTCDINKILGIK
ncbi:MAG: leucine-rich repeat protein [Muribaculaceae bacterium]|nr:leucine-rich repeat protein [Muribaculaceae bacterium]